jgi:thiol-disulfide isomerase/thioredoxin
MRVDVAFSVSRAQASHESECPDIGPICAVRDEPPQRHESTLWIAETRILAEYGLASNLAVQAVLPFRLIGTKTTFTDLAGATLDLDYENIHHQDETLFGVGDPQLLLHTGFLLAPFRFGARAGLSFPLGETVPDPYDLGDRGLPHEHLQFGTGTFDPLIGADVALEFSSWSLAIFGHAQIPIDEGSHGYRSGARISEGIVGATGFGLAGWSFRAAVLAYHETAERWHGVVPTDDGNQGRTDLFVGPGVTIPLGGDWTMSVDVRGRVYGRAENAQLDLPVLVDISIGTLLHLESDEEDAHAHEHEDEGEGGDVEDVVHAGEAAALDPVPSKWTVYDFWAEWCEACKGLERDLRALAARDPRVAVRRVNIVDFDSPISKRELPGVSLLPRLRLVAPDGSLVWEASGPADELMHQLEDRLEDRADANE